MAKVLAASAACAGLFGRSAAFAPTAPGDVSLRGSWAPAVEIGTAPPTVVQPRSSALPWVCAALAGGAALGAAAPRRRHASGKRVSAMARSGVAVGDSVPAVGLDKGFPPEKVDLAAFCKGKKVVLVGLPGAFTPTWSSTQVPGYLSKEAELKAKGVSDVIVYCVNDGAVMTAWAADQGVEGSIITFLGDPRSELTQALGLVLDHPGPMSVLGTKRCKRFSMLIDDGVVKTINVSEGPDDPAGDDDPSASLVEKMLEDL